MNHFRLQFRRLATESLIAYAIGSFISMMVILLDFVISADLSWISTSGLMYIIFMLPIFLVADVLLALFLTYRFNKD